MKSIIPLISSSGQVIKLGGNSYDKSFIRFTASFHNHIFFSGYHKFNQHANVIQLYLFYETIIKLLGYTSLGVRNTKFRYETQNFHNFTFFNSYHKFGRAVRPLKQGIKQLHEKSR